MLTDPDWAKELARAQDAAVAAGKQLNALSRGELTVLHDAGRDIKLAADQQAESLIVARLQESGFPILAEESGATGDVGGSGPVWVVDPLDGTMNFSRGIPICCTAIALVVGDEPVLGVIHDFNRSETYAGLASGGAWLNGKPIQVSDVEDASRAILATGLPTHRDHSEAALAPTLQLFQCFRKVRMLGSAALMLAYLAAGRLDAYHEEDIMLWDVAAGIALVKGAGGYVSMAETGRAPWTRRVYCGARASIWDRVAPVT